MGPSLVLFVASRFFRTRRRTGGLGSSILSVTGIAAGVMTLTVILAIMNGFQLGFIESIIEISSYHLQASPADQGRSAESGADVSARLKGLPSVTAVVPFVERQVLAGGNVQRSRACVLRAVPPDLLSLDPSQGRRISIVEGAFSIAEQFSVAIGAELAVATGLRVGDTMTVTYMSQGAEARRDALRVTGIFRTGYFDFDVGLLFVSLATADTLVGGGIALPRTYGIKIANRFLDGRAAGEVSGLLAGEGYRIDSWRHYNKSFFDALFVEKLIMMVLVGLVFVVVGFNVYHSLRRAVFEKTEEIAVLKAIGVPPRHLQAIFIIEGFIIGLAGGAIGMILGVALSVNVGAVFSIVERAVNFVWRLAALALSPFAQTSGGAGFAIFSPMYFYLTEVPSRILLREAFLVVAFAVFACVGAAYGASRAVSRCRPSEVLRYE